MFFISRVPVEFAREHLWCQTAPVSSTGRETMVIPGCTQSDLLCYCFCKEELWWSGRQCQCVPGVLAVAETVA
jgi:hypothetical protein